MSLENELYINDQDAWTTWSAKLVDDSFANLLLPPAPKEFITNNSRASDGLQVLDDSIVKDARSVQVILAITCDSMSDYLSKYNSLVNELSAGWITFKVVPLGLIYNFLVESYMSLSVGNGIRDGKLTVKFKESDPTNRTEL